MVLEKELIIKGGTVIDPSQGLNGNFDIALSEGKISKVETSINEKGSQEVFDATGLIVVPGLIDLHIHAFWGGSTYGIDPDTLSYTHLTLPTTPNV